MLGNLLGTCEQCQGALCLRDVLVCCIECGLPVPNHPRARQVASRKPAAAPVARPVQQTPALPTPAQQGGQRKKG